MRKILILCFALFLTAAVAPLVGGRATVYAADDYPQKYKKADKDELIDEWRFYNRECVSFVAWCLNSRNKVNFSNSYRDQWWGNANHWGEAAKAAGFKVDDHPVRGAVAWTTAGYYGHVAWVAKVDGDQVYIEEYNLKNTGTYYERVMDKSEFKYIHIRDIDCTVAHAWDGGRVVKKAVGKKDGVRTYTCIECGKTKDSGIYSPKTYELSQKRYTCNGKAKKPAVVVKNRKGQVIGRKQYTLAYAGNKKVGTAKVTIRFKGSYSGKKTLKYTILPKGTGITEAIGGEKAVTLRWKSMSKNCRGYQIRYSKSPAFVAFKTKNISGNLRKERKISGLSPDTTYYIQIRVYTIVKGKRYYSAWSHPEKTKVLP